MKIFQWMHAATAAALLTAFVGCDEQDFENDSTVIETQPSDTYESDPTAPAALEDLQQNSQNNPLGDPNADDTLDDAALDNDAFELENSLDAPAAPEASAPEADPQEASTPDSDPQAGNGAPAPAEQSPLEQLDEEDVVEVEEQP